MRGLVARGSRWPKSARNEGIAVKLVIVGGVAGGASAATRARRLSESAEIVLIERGPDVSFANCGLPYFIGGTIAEREKLLVAKPEMLRERFRLDVRTRSEVTGIDREGKTVHVREVETGREYDESYDKLILSPGAAPLRPGLPGIDLPGIHTLRNLEDADRLLALATASGTRHAVVVGAGFIGLEMAENLVHRKIGTTLVELQDQVLPPLDPEMTAPIAETLKGHGVDLRLSRSVQGFAADPDGGLVVNLSDGATVKAQMVVLGIGVRPESGLAAGAGLAVGPRGGIRVNAQMQTLDDPDIYAVGDAVETFDFVSGQPAQVPLAGPANRQGRIAADHAFGREDVAYRGTQGTAIVGVFEQVAAMTGLGEKSLVRMKMDYRKVYVHPNDHAGYYPGAQGMTIKLLFAPEGGRILGAQIVGQGGVDKRIDVLAMAIQAGMTVFDLEEAELAYAPQFGSAKDAINMAGFVASDVLRGEYPQVQASDVPGDYAKVVDVRTEREFAGGSIEGAVNVPLDSLRKHLGSLPKSGTILMTCAAGQRGYVATRMLRHLGYDATNLAGGYRTYRMVRAASRGQ
jgi:NADPH-dependent 2,4-dienoyl-CoA reductase/sulfur reductase-like enzyme/rhodanese-related sulfurtransferase